MEFCARGSLGDMISSTPPYKLREDVARRYFQQLVDAVMFCHSRGVFHRDLKRHNLLLDANDTLKVADFGLSSILNWKDLGDSGLPKGYDRGGTRSHMSPEVISFQSSHGGYLFGPAIWSCGVILYNMLTRNTPFCNPRADMYDRIMHGDVDYPPKMHPKVVKFISRFLEPDIDARIQPAEIYANPWFLVGYVPPDFRNLYEVNANLKAVEDVSSQAFFPKRRRIELLSTPVDWYHVDVAIDYYAAQKLTPISLETPDTARHAKGLRLTSMNPLTEILKQLVPILTGLGFETELHKTERKIKLWVPIARKEPWAKPLCILGEVFQPASSDDTCNVLFRRVTGAPRE